MNKIKKMFYEMVVELRNVSYPAPRELWGSTTIVIVASAILAVCIGFIDILFSQLMGRILR